MSTNGQLEVIVTQLTHKLVKAEEQLETHRGLVKMLSNRENFWVFVQDVKASFDQAYRSCDAGDGERLRRELHRLEGHMAIYSLNTLAQRVRQLGDTAVVNLRAVKQLEAQFKAFLDEHRALLGVSYGLANEESFVIPGKIVDAYETKTEVASDLGELQAICRDFFRLIRLKRARTVLGPIEASLQNLSLRAGKPVRISVVGAETLVPVESMPVLRSLHHVLRNALDHGIELPHERGDKDEIGEISVSVTDDGQKLRLDICDDGRGLEPQVLAAADPVAVLASHGGGLAAFLATVDEAGGGVKITSQPGVGTTVTVTLPRAIWSPHTPTKLAVASSF